jgi:3-oxoacyl-[acyl-carrier protein] reductase
MKKTAVITGGNGGIGQAIADELSRDHVIILHYFGDIGHLDSWMADVHDRGGTIIPVEAELSSQAGCEKFHSQVLEKVGSSIEVLVNSAGGIVQAHNIGTLTWELMEKHFNLNAFSPMYVTALFAPLLRNGENPSVVNITSGSIRNGSITSPAYGAAKGAMDVFTRGLAHELAPKVRVNAIAPGVIMTRFYDNVAPEVLVTLKEKTPLKKLGTPQEVAKTVRYLVETSYLTGVTIDLNGGLYMR